MPYGRKEIIRTRKLGTDFTNDSFYSEEYGSGQWKPVSLLGIFYCGAFSTVVFIGVLYGRCPLEHRLVQYVSVLGLYASHAGKETPSVITYTDRAILQVWKVIGSLFVLTVVIMSLLAFHYGGVNFSLMLPLSLLYSGIGVSITGIIIRSRVVMWSPLVGFCFAIYMLMAYTLHQAVTIDWYLYFGLSFVVMMVLPGHYLNRKARNVC